MISEKTLNILYLGYSGFPYGYAELQKIMLISKALVCEEAMVTILGSRGYHDQITYPDLKKTGHFQGIKYVYSSGTPYRHTNFIKRNMAKPFEGMMEYKAIRKINKKRKIDIAIISSARFIDVLRYKCISSKLGFNILLNFVEYRSAISSWKELKYKVNDILFDRYAVKVSDGVLVISEFLIDIVKNIDPRKPYFKIPMMVDAERYSGIERNKSERYFLFCGAAFYKEIIFFNIRAFELIDNKNTFLYLIINGSQEQIAEIEKRISSSSKSDLIKTFSGLSDRELSNHYLNATGLLIPLRPTIQDTARFPHKIGEYLSSGNPLVTTNYGEVKYYFKDEINALVAEEYEEHAFAEKMSYILANPLESASIGENGRQIALEHADYRKYGKKIINFINEVISK